ncbi:MAG TPA: hypothetical protein IGS40_10880 [Trichormus sp. M33_DOE_039]|nr:hypothetical protein [Trichormus sp. M33_DOE_039]
MSASTKYSAAKQWYNSDDTYYQILLVSPEQETKVKYLKTKIIVKTRRDFYQYQLDDQTQEKLKIYYPDKPDTIGSCLPSPGVVFPTDYLNLLLPEQGVKNISSALNNIYETTQTLLQTRKISQLIAKTWHAYLTAKDEVKPWANFILGNWDDVNTDNNIDILDDLISREIFFFDQEFSPDYLEPDNLNIYYPLNQKHCQNGKPDEDRFLILPSSEGWQGIALSLLMAGQAYYEIKQDGEIKYHQIAQPILSTGDIVFRYGLEVDWNNFKGNIQEMQLEPGKYSIASKATVPYPPIPSERNLSHSQIEEWATAQDEDGDLPFYIKDEKGNYSLDVQYFTPPYPYLPLSTC